MHSISLLFISQESGWSDSELLQKTVKEKVIAVLISL